MENAIFLPEGALLVPTGHAGSPWGPGLLHGGPPAGLLARAIERANVDPELHVARLTIDLFRPIPAEPLHTTVEPLRAGRRIAVLEATLFAGETAVSRASALLLRRSVIALPPHLLPPPPWVEHHESIPTTTMGGFFARSEGALAREAREGMLPGFHTAVEVRGVGGVPGSGRATAWIRIPMPFVAGEETSPLVRVAATADFGNALGHIRAGEDVGFINADITVYLHRLPGGEWICLEANGVAQEYGLGMVDSVVHDVHGPVGRVSQALLANRRFGAGR